MTTNNKTAPAARVISQQQLEAKVSQGRRWVKAFTRAIIPGRKPPLPPMTFARFGGGDKLAASKRNYAAVNSSDPRFISVNVMTAEILAGALIVGPDVDAIAKLTGHSRVEVARRAKKMRANKLWEGTDIKADEWFDDKNGPVAFWQHTLVADGLVIVPSSHIGK